MLLAIEEGIEGTGGGDDSMLLKAAWLKPGLNAVGSVHQICEHELH